LWLGTLLRLGVGGVFVASGWLKVANPTESVRAVQAYDLVPYGLARWVGYGLPFLEIAIAVLLIVGLATRFGAGVAIVLLLVFIAAVTSAWARGLTIDCGCFGGGGQVASNETRYLQEIVRDVALLAAASWLVWQPRTRFAFDRTGEQELPANEPTTAG
jgi:uncharacterized membrane protein YphA (DoxX/SURF4 family)